jgi:3-hydroxyisobutyrate dehydrogenase-like beta-hydroxyacid dehydrogenase
MGHGIADNFLKHGYDLTVWNRSAEKAQDLVARGARLAASVADAVESADIVFEVTANDESSRGLWLGENGIIAHTNAAQTLISCATLSVEWVDELAKTCAEKGLTFFDMPMTGSRAGAEGGTMLLLAGGEEQKLNEVKPHLEKIASQVKLFGPAGYGTRIKLVLNCLQAVHLAGFGEAMRLANAFGLDEKLTGEMLVEKPGGATTQMAWRDYQNHPDPINFAVELIAKDETYALRNIDATQVPLISQTLTEYQKAITDGHAHNDWTYITR